MILVGILVTQIMRFSN